MKQKTIITELFEDIEKFGWDLVKDKIHFYKNAEKLQIINAHYSANIELMKEIVPELLDKCLNDFEDAEQYHKETYD